MERKVNRTLIRIIEGNIADQQTEAIVNAANNQLWMGTGVAGEIKSQGGSQIEDEAVSKGPIKVGDAVITGAGKLKAEFVVHAASMGDSPVNVKSATINSLQIAAIKGVKSISFPALATGVACLPVEECARIMIKVTLDFVQKETQFEEIRFVLWGTQNLDVFKRILRNYLEKE